MSIQQPIHEIITPIVSVPTISVRELGEEKERRKRVCIQWYGEAGCKMPEGAQFHFEPTATPNDRCWCGEPEAFKVIFIGPVRKWPRQDIVQQIADMATHGDLDGSIVWMVSARFSQPHRTATYAPASLMTPVVLLGDPNCGVIKPRHYCDMKVLEEENAKARESMTSAERLTENPEMELPPEALPWTDQWPECTRCASFEHSYDEKPAVPLKGTVHDLTYLCLECGRRWWQFNDYYHLWKHVTSRKEWDVVRRQAILQEAGLVPDQ